MHVRVCAHVRVHVHVRVYVHVHAHVCVCKQGFEPTTHCVLGRASANTRVTCTQVANIKAYMYEGVMYMSVHMFYMYLATTFDSTISIHHKCTVLPCLHLSVNERER